MYNALQNHNRSTARAFALPELLIIVLLLIAVACIVAVLAPDAHRKAQCAASLTNLQRLGAGIADYGQDNADSIVSFTWRGGVSHNCGTYLFPVAIDDNTAASHQAVCILRDHAGRTDIFAISGWFPHITVNLLPLMVYLDEPLPSRLMVSPGDRLRLLWQDAVTRVPNDPNQPYFALANRPAYPQSDNTAKRWPYTSSYEMPPSFYSPDRGTAQNPTINQSPNGHRFFNVGTASTPLGQRLLSEVRFPTQKAMLYETNQRFFGSRQTYFMYPAARVPVLAVDGSAKVRSTSNGNNGWDPNVGNANPTRVSYQPELSWEALTESGFASDIVDAGMRFTQRGLQGRDFGGPEVTP